MLSRRAFVAGLAAFSAGCQRRKISGYSGYAFVANQEGNAVAAVDLEVFAVARHIPLKGRPAAVLAHPHRPMVYALTPENGLVHEISANSLSATRILQLASRTVSMRFDPHATALHVLCGNPRKLVRVALDSFRAEGEMPLVAEPVDFDIAPDGNFVAVSYGEERLLALGTLRDGMDRPIPTSGAIASVRFQSDSRQLIAADLTRRMLTVYYSGSKKLVTNLPLPLRPDNLCFSGDGGQLFVTGAGMDGVVIVYPYYTPQIGETLLAGHAPGAMASSLNPSYLFVANPSSGDVTIIDTVKHRVIAATPVGSDPGYIALTPDDRYALVLNQGSGDVAVIRTASIMRTVAEQRHSRKGALFMMIPVGSKPVSAAITAI